MLINIKSYQLIFLDFSSEIVKSLNTVRLVQCRFEPLHLVTIWVSILDAIKKVYRTTYRIAVTSWFSYTYLIIFFFF